MTVAPIEIGLRVVVADGRARVRKRFRDALERSGIVVCAEAADGVGAVKAVTRHRPDVVLLDVHMPGDGITTACAIREIASNTPVVMLTEFEDDFQLFAALEAGAAGYLLKDMDLSRLPDVLEGVLRGEAALPRTMVTRVVEEFNARGRALDLLVGRNPADRLTNREWEVLELMRRDFGTAQIAEALFVSSATVRTHVSAIMRKLQVPDRAAAVRLIEERSA